jgi:WD40 repeat protein
VAASANGRQAVSASEDRTLKVWDLENGRALRTLEGHSNKVQGVAVSADGRRAVSSVACNFTRKSRWHEKVESDPGGDKLPRSKALKGAIRRCGDELMKETSKSRAKCERKTKIAKTAGTVPQDTKEVMADLWRS